MKTKLNLRAYIEIITKGTVLGLNWIFESFTVRAVPLYKVVCCIIKWIVIVFMVNYLS